MKLNKIISLAVIVVSLTFNSARADGLNPADNIHAFADLLRAQGEFQLALAQADLAESQAQLELAKAAKEFQRVRELALLVNRLQLELRTAAKNEFKNRQQLTEMEAFTKSLGVLKLGTTNSRVFQAINVIIMRAVSPDALTRVMSAPIEPLAADNFIANGTLHGEEDFKGTNVGQLFTFIRKNNLSVEPFSPAHMAILNALTEFEADAQRRVTELKIRQDELEHRVFTPAPEPGNPMVVPPTTPAPIPHP